MAEARWVVVDTETSGLDPVTDRLLAIGAVAVDGEGIRLHDSFEVVLRADVASDSDNVAIHGIGHDAQEKGMPVREALAHLTPTSRGAPCAGFHCEFDRVALAQCAKAAGIALPLRSWLDVEAAGGGTCPRGRPARRTQSRRLADPIRDRCRRAPQRSRRRARDRGTAAAPARAGGNTACHRIYRAAETVAAASLAGRLIRRRANSSGRKSSSSDRRPRKKARSVAGLFVGARIGVRCRLCSWYRP